MIINLYLEVIWKLFGSYLDIWQEKGEIRY